MPIRYRSTLRFSPVRCARLALAVAMAISFEALSPTGAIASGLKAVMPLQPDVSLAPPAAGKMTPDLTSLLGALRAMSPEEREWVSSSRADHLAVPVYRTAGANASYLQVYVEVTEISGDTLHQLRNEGFAVEYVVSDSRIVQGFAPLDSVECVAELPCVVRVSRPYYSLCNTAQETASQGQYVTRGDQLMETDFMRTSAGLNGEGVTIGVMSVGLFNQTFQPVGPAEASWSDRRIVSRDIPAEYPDVGDDRDVKNFGGVEVYPSANLAWLMVPSVTYGELLFLPSDLALDPDSGSPVDYYQQRPVVWGTAGNEVRAAGAMMLEVVHDLAPNARLLFGSARTDVEFYLQRERLVENGADVIVDDVAFPGLGRYDGTSALSKRATEIVREENIVYITAVGDYTPPTPSPTPSPTPTPVGATPQPTPPPDYSVSANGKPLFLNTFFNSNPHATIQKFHAFNDPTDPHRDETLEISADPTLGFFEAYLVWDDVWVNPQYGYTDGEEKFQLDYYQPVGRASDDFDLYIVDRDTLDISRPLAFSNNLQNGRSDNPVERVVTINNSIPMSLVIRRKNPLDNRPTFMTLVITAGSVEEPDYLTHGIPLCNNDALGGVLSVGSVDLRKPSLDFVTDDTIPGLDPGPGAKRYNRFLQWRPGSQKPDVCCYENVETYTSQSYSDPTSRYYARGTSIAAAHVAGFCALLRQMRPTLHAQQYLGILTNTKPVAGDTDPLHANAIPISVETSRLYGNAPVYKRLEAGNVYRNLLTAPTVLGESSAATTVQQFEQGQGLWTHGPLTGSPFALPVFEARDGKLVLRATQVNTFGYWESPILTYVDSASGAPSSSLNANRLYRLTVRMSSSQSDPNKVPDFRIRLITSSVDEVAEIVVNSVSLDGANAPRDNQPKTYSLYYQPTPEAALYGVRVAIDMIHFNTHDDSTAELFIEQVNFEQLDLPATPPAE